MKLRIGTLLLSLGFVLSCSPEASKQYVQPEYEKTNVSQDPNIQYFDPTVDILFVVDNSGSMGTHQQNLADNISKFTKTFSKNSILKYNIGVVTTDMMGCYYSNCDSMGRLVGAIKVVSNGTPNKDTVLADNLTVGTGGSSFEESFAPVLAALDPTMLAGTNAGFYRPGASLAIIFITDAEDQSRNITPKQFYASLVQMKNQDPKKVLGYGVIVPTGVADCPRDEYANPDRIEDFLGMVVNGSKGQNVFNLCDPDFGQRIAGMAKDIVDEVGGVFYLNRMPAVDSIRVTYGKALLPQDAKKGWSFDAGRNAIVLGDQIDWESQPTGSRIMVNYEVADTSGL